MFGLSSSRQYLSLLYIVIAAFVSTSTAQNKKYWCTKEGVSKGPELPQFPDSFTIHSEVNDRTKQYVADMIRSVDLKRRRESIELWAGKRHVRYISLAEEDTFINIVYTPKGPSCTTSVLSKTDKHDVYTEKNAGPLGVLQAIVEEILPKRDNFISYEDADIRGHTKTPIWEICEYSSTLDKVLKVNLYFSNPAWALAHQNTTEPIQVMMRMKVEGYKEGSKEDPLSLVLDIYSYESNTTSDKYFQVPEDVHCPGFRTNKKPPAIPNYFSYQSEKLVEQNKGSFLVLNSKVYYDFTSKLIRVDSQSALKTSDLTESKSVIMDFNSGVKYTVNTDVGSCEKETLSSSMNFANDLDKVTNMQNPKEFFLLQSDNFSYIGEYDTRALSTDVYSGVIGSTDAQNSVYFWYFTPDRTKLIENEVEKNVLVKVVSRPESLLARQTKTVINFYNFNTAKPNPFVFDISTCFNESQSKTYVITFPGEQNALVEKYSFVLQHRTHEVLRTKGGVSPQRISMQKITFGDNYFLVQFKILDSSAVAKSSKENDLGQAESKIRDAVSAKELIVSFYAREQVVHLTAEPDGFKEFKEDSKEITFNEKSVAGLSIGMTVLGFLLGGVVVNLIFTKKYGISLWQKTSSASDEQTFNNPLNESEI